MLLTIPLLNKGSFLGSLINKCRQVVRIKPVNKLETNIKPNISTSITTSTTLINDTQTPPASTNFETNRPVTDTNIRLIRHSYATKTIEEKAGLPPKPKKPLTPYFRYMGEVRPKLKAENPNLSLVDTVRQLTKQWQTVDPSVKERLQEEYKKDKQKYIEARTKYDAKITDEQHLHLKEIKQLKVAAKEKRMMRKRVRLLGKPKKPASAFIRFIVKERALTPQSVNETFREWHRKATAKWSMMSQEQKDVFIREARQEIEKYKKELSLWEEDMIRLGQIDVVRHSNLIDPPEAKPKKLSFK